LIWFGANGAIHIAVGCNQNNTSHTDGWGCLYETYANDTGIDGLILFTGERNFTVKELEIFELID
jgi:hypothetical protein